MSIQEAVDDQHEAVRAVVREELDAVVPYVVTALKRHDGVADLARRLNEAERRLAARDQRPMVSRVYRLVGLIRRLELPEDVHAMLVGELLDVLTGAGYSEFGETAEAFDPVRHEALDAAAPDGAAVVAEVYEPGLKTLGEVVVRARVRVGAASASEAIEEDS